VHVGTIAVRSGIPHDQDQWGWRCGFYPASHRGEQADGTTVTFEQARAAFETAWRSLLPKLSEAHFEAWRESGSLDRGEISPLRSRRAHAAGLERAREPRCWLIGN